MARIFRAKKTTGMLKATGFIIVVVLLVALIYLSIGNLGATQEERQLKLAQDAITNAAVQCYALESHFPPSLEYLADNYGLTLDTDKYVYHYKTIGSNMVPEIQVFLKDSDEGGR
jgi:competence protein ComGC